MKRGALAFLAVVGLAGGSAPTAAGQTDEGLQILHDGVGCVVAGQFPRLEARVEPEGDVGRVRVQFSSPDSPAWYFVEMTPADGTYVGVLPKPQASLKSFSYYIEVTGTRAETCRTPEYHPVVVGSAGECDRRVLAAAIAEKGPSFIGTTEGAPATPPGFVAGAAAATAGAAAGAAAASSGLSTAATVGIVAGGAALAAGVAVAAGGGGSDDTTPSTTPSTTPPTTQAARPPQHLQLALGDNCALSGGTAIYAGDTLTISRGMCAWPSAAEAEAAAATAPASLTVDGVELAPLRYSIAVPHSTGDGIFCNVPEADWIATAGSHTAAGVWPIIEMDTLIVCSFTVLP